MIVHRTNRFRLSVAGVALLSALLLAGIVAGGKPPAAHHRAEAPHLAVTAEGSRLLLNAEQWWPSGFNAYQLTTNWSVNVGCGAQTDLDAYFAALPLRSLTRFSLFAPSTIRADDGTIDYSAADAVFDAAERHGQLVLPVLSAGDGACDGGTFKTAAWYTSGWREQQMSAHGTFLSWLRAAVTRWKDSPALAGWTAVGEAEPSDCPRSGGGREPDTIQSSCSDWRTRTCPATAVSVLRTFFDQAGAEIAAIDPGRLRFAGLLGADQCGSAGLGFAEVGASPGIDVLEYHDYTLTEPAPATESVPARMATALELNKPLIVAEIGLQGGSCLPLDQRASLIRGAIGTQRALGTAGALAWSYVPDPRPSRCTFDIGEGDPLWPRLVP